MTSAINSWNTESVLKTIDHGLGQWQSLSSDLCKPVFAYVKNPAEKGNGHQETTWEKVGRLATRLLLNICLVPTVLLAGSLKLIEKGAEFGSAAKIQISNYFSQREAAVEKIG